MTKKTDKSIAKRFEGGGLDFDQVVADFKRDIIMRVLELTRGEDGETNLSHAAAMLKMNRPTLYMICERSNIPISQHKSKNRKVQIRVNRKCQRCRHVEKRIYAMPCSNCGCRSSDKAKR